MRSRRSWKAQRYTRDVACALHTFGTRKAFFTQRPHRKTNRLQLPEGRIAPSTVIYNNLASAVPWVWDEGGKNNKRMATLWHSAANQRAGCWHKCCTVMNSMQKREREKNVTKGHSRTQAKSSHSLCTYNNTLTGQDTRLLAEPWLAPFQSASRVTLDKRTKKKKKREHFWGHNKHSKELLKTNAKQTISSS